MTLINEWLGVGARTAFELLLILAYMLVVLGMRAPLRLRFWRRSDAHRRMSRSDVGPRKFWVKSRDGAHRSVGAVCGSIRRYSQAGGD